MMGDNVMKTKNCLLNKKSKLVLLDILSGKMMLKGNC